MSELKALLQQIKKFRDARDWQKFHTPRNLAESLVLEASEVLEHFQWKTDAEIKTHLKKHRQEFSHELADVFNYLLLLADQTGIDLIQAAHQKIQLNRCKYPVKKAKGSAKKYTHYRQS